MPGLRQRNALPTAGFTIASNIRACKLRSPQWKIDLKIILNHVWIGLKGLRPWSYLRINLPFSWSTWLHLWVQNPPSSPLICPALPSTGPDPAEGTKSKIAGYPDMPSIHSKKRNGGFGYLQFCTSIRCTNFQSLLSLTAMTDMTLSLSLCLTSGYHQWESKLDEHMPQSLWSVPRHRPTLKALHCNAGSPFFKEFHRDPSAVTNSLRADKSTNPAGKLCDCAVGPEPWK